MPTDDSPIALFYRALPFRGTRQSRLVTVILGTWSKHFRIVAFIAKVPKYTQQYTMPDLPWRLFSSQYARNPRLHINVEVWKPEGYVYHPLSPNLSFQESVLLASKSSMLEKGLAPPRSFHLGSIEPTCIGSRWFNNFWRCTMTWTNIRIKKNRPNQPRIQELKEYKNNIHNGNQKILTQMQK